MTIRTWKLAWKILLLVQCCLISACSHDDPIKIGFAGGLTGRHADLGIYGRNGVLLAIEEVNARDGVKGRPVELIIKDDRQDPEIARAVDQELIDEGVVAIIGHFTSAMSVAAVETANREGVVLFSPTTATNQLTGIDDYFLRLISPNTKAIEALADHVFVAMGLRAISVIYDQQNQAFSLEWLNRFTQIGEEYDAKVEGIGYRSAPELQFGDIAHKALAAEPDGVLVVAAALDGAMLCQQLRKFRSDVPIMATLWSMSDDFIQHAGAAGEGVIFTNWFDPEHQGERYVEFQRKYENRFGGVPNFAGLFAYETATVLLQALMVTTDPGELKETILARKEYDGVQGKIGIDQFGDAEREYFLMTVRDGTFKRVGH